MKTKTTAEQIKTILAALSAFHAKPFCHESGDPRADAQRNLRGRTHYVDDDTLHFHHSRIVGGHEEHGGLVYVLTTSDALDWENTRRGFRTVIFDAFGTVIERPKLEESSSTSAQARKIADAVEVDLLAHYREAIAEQIRQRQESLIELQAAQALLAS